MSTSPSRRPVDRESGGSTAGHEFARARSPNVPLAAAEADQVAEDSVREFFAILWRRKLAVLIPLVLTPILAFANATRQEPVYAASADVLVTSGTVASALSELPGLSSSDDPERNASTQLKLARLPRVAERVIEAAALEESTQQFLDRSSVSASTDADILHFTVKDPDPDEARNLATVYGQEFTNYRNDLDLQGIRSMLQKIRRTLARLAASGEKESVLYAQLTQAERRLEGAEAVQGSAAILVQPAVTAVQISPNPRKDVVLGLALGILLGVGCAFLVDRLDTRIRSAEEAESILGIPVLGELSQPPALPEGSRSEATMLELPHGTYAEAVRKLRSNFDFARLDAEARILVVSSAVVGEGKTTVASDLAIALARSGRDVVLCDLDARSPSLQRMFGLEGRLGLVDVAFGEASLGQALVRVSWGAPGRVATLASSGAPGDSEEASAAPSGSDAASGRLQVLTLGTKRPPSPADFVGSARVRELIETLAAGHDLVIVDAPPLLPVSDALTISEYADAALIVVGLQTSTRPRLRAVRRMLSAFPTRVLGVAVTGVSAGVGYGGYAEPEPPAVAAVT